MKRRRRLHFKKGFYILVLVVIGIIVSTILYIKHNNYIHSNPYLLKQQGYNEKEINRVIGNNNIIKVLLSREYNPYLIDILESKYYIESNLDSYIKYKTKYPDKDYKDVIAIINVTNGKDFYTNEKEVDMSKGDLILVNKYYYLAEDYEPEDLVNMEVKYATSNKKVRSHVYDAFKSLVAAAKRSDIKIYANTTYRTYKAQENAYQNAKNQKGRAYADTYAARPGFSEHQTGLAIDVHTSLPNEEFVESETYKWLVENASTYGFILRYPKDKEYLTGFKFEPYHLRYVGVEVAKQIEKEGITFDEYYAYYVR